MFVMKENWWRAKTWEWKTNDMLHSHFISHFINSLYDSQLRPLRYVNRQGLVKSMFLCWSLIIKLCKKFGPGMGMAWACLLKTLKICGWNLPIEEQFLPTNNDWGIWNLSSLHLPSDGNSSAIKINLVHQNTPPYMKFPYWH